MLYQKGEKLKVLKETIESIPALSGLKESDFVMSAKEIKKFEAPIRKVFKELNDVLYNTLISSEDTDTKRDKVYWAVESVALYLLEHYEEDLIDNFYEEKLYFYENMFVILVRNELCVRYKEYKDMLITIPNAYWKLTKNDKRPAFHQISHFISDYQDISEDIDNILQDATKAHLTHCLELILEKISELVKEECKKEFLNPAVLPDRLRHLIYLLKSELSLALDTEE